MAQGFIDGVLKGIDTIADTHHAITKFIRSRGYRVKRKVFSAVLQLFFLLIGVSCLFLGLILVLDNFMRLEYVLVGIGFVTIYAVLVIGKFR
ncbi:hypothetical protein CL620_01290 [archaeon]|jgi:hypothetical protein|nr:hypothetical protein [archaeon]